MGEAFVNSLAITIPATIIPHPDRRLRRVRVHLHAVPRPRPLLILIVGLLVVPTQVALVPLLKIYGDLGINGTFPAIWLVHIGFGMPLAVYIIRNYMATLPREVIESAKIDGASHFQTFWKLILPMSTPVLASFAIFQFLWVWNDLLNALVFIGPGENQPLTIALVQLLGPAGPGLAAAHGGRPVHDDRADPRVPVPAAVLRPRHDRRRGQGLTAVGAGSSRRRSRTVHGAMADVLATVAVDRERARVYEHGWQSWSPTTAYRLDERPFRPVSDLRRVGNYRPERTAPDGRVLGRGPARRRPGHRRRRARLRARRRPPGPSRRSGRRSPATPSW